MGRLIVCGLLTAVLCAVLHIVHESSQAHLCGICGTPDAELAVVVRPHDELLTPVAEKVSRHAGHRF